MQLRGNQICSVKVILSFPKFVKRNYFLSCIIDFDRLWETKIRSKALTVAVEFTGDVCITSGVLNLYTVSRLFRLRPRHWFA